MYSVSLFSNAGWLVEKYKFHTFISLTSFLFPVISHTFLIIFLLQKENRYSVYYSDPGAWPHMIRKVVPKFYLIHQ